MHVRPRNRVGDGSSDNLPYACTAAARHHLGSEVPGRANTIRDRKCMLYDRILCTYEQLFRTGGKALLSPLSTSRKPSHPFSAYGSDGRTAHKSHVCATVHYDAHTCYAYTHCIGL